MYDIWMASYSPSQFDAKIAAQEFFCRPVASSLSTPSRLRRLVPLASKVTASESLH